MKLEDVLAARTRIKPAIHKTPLFHATRLSQMLGCDLFVKADNLQKTGAFKARGVLNFLLQHPGCCPVTTFSSGNHGGALAWGAKSLKRQATIFMPEDASPVKVAAARGLQADVRFAGLSSQDRAIACQNFVLETGALLVPPYDHKDIIAGQGTAMLEVLEDLPDVQVALLPLGGGGFLSGNALVARELRTNLEVYGCEPELAADGHASLKAGSIQKIPYPATIADGLRALSIGNLNWEIIKDSVHDVLCCSEIEIRRAMAAYATFMKLYVEPSGAVSLASLWTHRRQFAGKRVVVFVSGGNIALPDYSRLVTEDVSSFE